MPKEEIEQKDMVRYNSSADLQDAWLRAVDLTISDLAGIWKESMQVLQAQMHDDENPQLAHKAAVRLSHLMTEITRAYGDIPSDRRQNTPIVVKPNPFGEDA